MSMDVSGKPPVKCLNHGFCKYLSNWVKCLGLSHPSHLISYALHWMVLSRDASLFCPYLCKINPILVFFSPVVFSVYHCLCGWPWHSLLILCVLSHCGTWLSQLLFDSWGPCWAYDPWVTHPWQYKSSFHTAQLGLSVCHQPSPALTEVSHTLSPEAPPLRLSTQMKAGKSWQPLRRNLPQEEGSPGRG